MKKPYDVEAWLLVMRKFFRLHDYSEIMKAKVVTLNLKGKVDISWEDVKNGRGIYEEELTWIEFKRLFWKKYLSKRYYDARDKGFYELQLVSMTNAEYTSKFFELLRYVPYLNEEMDNIHRFISGFPVAYRDWIELYELKSLEDSIRKLNHCYEQ